MSVIGDALVVQMMKRIGFSRHDYALRHHGGYLGKKSRGETV
jgi:arabinose-5-phosphate isomerase